MNLRDEIRQAYDSVHAPEDLAERMKQELYLTDLSEPETGEKLTFEAVRAPRRPIGHYVLYIAASLSLCVGLGMSVWSMRSRVTPLSPQAPVEVVEDTTEPTTDAMQLP